jgi:hypothetical protein
MPVKVGWKLTIGVRLWDIYGIDKSTCVTWSCTGVAIGVTVGAVIGIVGIGEDEALAGDVGELPPPLGLGGGLGGVYVTVMADEFGPAALVRL